MRYQDYLAEATRTAFEEAFKTARHVRPDKLEWVPMEEARTVLDIVQELATSAAWTEEMVSKSGEDFAAELKDPNYSTNRQKKKEALRAQLPTVEDCYRLGKKNLDRFSEFLDTFPDELIGQSKWLPFEGGKKYPIMELLSYAHWNFQYHHGQMAYIETLYGDKEMV